MKYKSLYSILCDAKTPDKINELNAISLWVANNKVKYTNVAGHAAVMTENAKESALLSLNDCICLLQGQRISAYHSLDEFHYYLEQVACENISLHRIWVNETSQTIVVRSNGYNDVIVETIEDFNQLNDYLPNASEVIRRWEHVASYGVSLGENTVTLTGLKPRSIKSIKEAISRILASQG